MSVSSRTSSGRSRHRAWPVFVIAALAVALAPATMLDVARGVGLEAATHLVVSEVVTGGASASDELIELHNPTTSALPLEGLEVIYVTSSGATISRRAAWEVGAPSVPAGGHVLIANASGIYASIADATLSRGWPRPVGASRSASSGRAPQSTPPAGERPRARGGRGHRPPLRVPVRASSAGPAGHSAPPTTRTTTLRTLRNASSPDHRISARRRRQIRRQRPCQARPLARRWSRPRQRRPPLRRRPHRWPRSPRLARRRMGRP